MPEPIANIIGEPQELATTLLDHWTLTSDLERIEGCEWYPQAHEHAIEIGNGDITVGAGIISALSPQVSWNENLRIARETVRLGFGIGNYSANNRKASAILNGAPPLEVLGGNKVRSFYALILDPNNAYDVCVDRHALSCAVGRVLDDRERKILERKGAYDHVADAYRKSAAEIGLRPHEVQATLWLYWRTVKKVGINQGSLW